MLGPKLEFRRNFAFWRAPLLLAYMNRYGSRIPELGRIFNQAIRNRITPKGA